MTLKKFPFPLVILVFIFFFQVSGQKKSITLESIWNGTLKAQSIEVLRPMNNGREYSVLNMNASERSSSVDSYSYETLRKTRTLVATDPDNGIPYFTSYEFSPDESMILLATSEESLFRRSTQGIYYVYWPGKKSVVRVSEHKIREPTFSPDGRHIAYVYKNDIYLFDLQSETTLQITSDGKQNNIINGVSDWVYEEEFSIVKAFEWNSTGEYLAFLRFDESQVAEFSMDVFGQNLYPFQYRFKYPKAGEDNSFVSLHLYELAGKMTHRIALQQDYYIPRLKWMNNPGHLCVQTLNRHQNRLQLYKVDALTHTARLILEETDPAYVDITDELNFLPDDRFLWTSERNGFNHLYLYGKDGELQRQLTDGPWEITKLYGYHAESDRIYYQSTENGSINRGLFSINSRGKQKRRLSDETGTNDAQFSTDYSYYISTFSNSTTPPKYSLHEASTGKFLRTIEDNSELSEKLQEYHISPREYSTITINGNDLNMWMVKPRDFDAGRQYPLLLFQYSGPGSQEVANSWMNRDDYWHQVLAEAGYVIACVDGRGTGYKGREFKKLTYMELGKYEVEDQIAVATKLSSYPYIDEGRTGIWGWSYGGFMASNCLFRGSDTFEVAIAVAPVTNWRFYDTIYTERYMRTPQENPSGYDKNSPLTYAGRLQGEFLLVHGSGDDNVHVQNSMRLIDALVQHKKQFDWAIYPDRDHGIYGGNTQLHLYTLMTNFLKEHL